MLSVTNAHKHISVFVSHCVENNDEACQYAEAISEAGFTAFQYGHALHTGNLIKDTVARTITECDFFLFIVSDYSLQSEWVQRELGLALSLREQSGGYHPVIIPLYARESTWRRTRVPPIEFPVRDFESGDECSPFNLEAVRGLDKHANPTVDGDALLISEMTPQLLVSRIDLNHEGEFRNLKAFELYEALFPESERDSTEDILNWVLHSDLGKKRLLKLPGIAIEYTLDSRYFIMTLANRAIGLAFMTYDASSSIVYGNYIAVEKSWRPGDLATTFLEKITDVTGELFPDYRGIVFEVENFDRFNIERILDYLEQPGCAGFQAERDSDEFRKALRIVWYQRTGSFFFLDKQTKEPVVCRSPCLAPEIEDWESQEEDYWLMWQPRRDSVLDMDNCNDLWKEAINCVYVEILAKSLVESYPEFAPEYWPYACGIVERALEESREISMGRYFYRRDPLLKRLVQLRINIAV